MERGAVIAWRITAALGFTMLAIWLKNGGMQQSGAVGGKIPPWLILTHFLLAAGGLLVWIVYVASDKDALAWIAFVVLAVVALLGWTMFFGWARQRRGVEPAPAGAVVTPGAEVRFPISVVVVHGLAAVTTVLLVLLT